MFVYVGDVVRGILSYNIFGRFCLEGSCSGIVSRGYFVVDSCTVQLCTVRRARLTCSCLFAVISVSIAPYHVLWISHYPAPFEVCAVMRDHEDAFTAFYLTESFLYRIVPVFAISALNVFIIVRLWRITRDRKRLLAAGRSVALTVTTTATTTTRTCTKPLQPDTMEMKAPNNDDNNKHGT